MLYIKVLHIIAVISWFSGLFYLPRLLHCAVLWRDQAAAYYLPIMVFKLYHYITTPAALIAIATGLALLCHHQEYVQDTWLHTKVAVVVLLVIYHCYLGHLVQILRSGAALACPNYYVLLTPLMLAVVVLSGLAIVKPLLGQV